MDARAITRRQKRKMDAKANCMHLFGPHADCRETRNERVCYRYYGSSDDHALMSLISKLDDGTSQREAFLRNPMMCVDTRCVPTSPSSPSSSKLSQLGVRTTTRYALDMTFTDFEFIAELVCQGLGWDTKFQSLAAVMILKCSHVQWDKNASLGNYREKQ